MNIIGLIVGVLFGAGLAISGMTDSEKVLGFLDVFGAWDISLMLVMASGLIVTVPVFFWARKQEKPFFNSEFSWPTKTAIDARLIIGAMLFGIGWGLYGYCPGPAISSLAYGYLDSIYFIVAMFVGMMLVSKIEA